MQIRGVAACVATRGRAGGEEIVLWCRCLRGGGGGGGGLGAERIAERGQREGAAAVLADHHLENGVERRLQGGRPASRRLRRMLKLADTSASKFGSNANRRVA